MTTAADLINQLITKRISRISTLDIGTISSVSAYDRVDVKLKHLSKGQVREYLDVPVLPHGGSNGRLYTYPAKGDTVLLGFLQHEPAPQLEQRAVITTINEQLQYIRPVVLATLPTTDDPPVQVPAEGETLITHESGSYIRFKSDGSIIICGTTVNVIAPGDAE
ncbi:MAG TPA: hypothetical protein O0X43_01060 [Methanocorpusculum sp.]|nr:hypothetical protein [Methanocorpusculum sp.]